MNDALADIDAEKVDKNVSESYKTIHKCVKVFGNIPGMPGLCIQLSCLMWLFHIFYVLTVPLT